MIGCSKSCSNMNTKVLSASSPNSILSALEILLSGGLVAFPTDTVYGVGSLAFHQQAIESIYVAKDRPMEKAIPVLIGDNEDLVQVAEEIPIFAMRLIDRFWPGPLTILVPKKPTLPEAISATSTVGVRVPDHDIARALLRLSGPMAVTSANISGQPSPTTAQQVLDQLNGRIAMIIDGGETPGGIPSTLVDCTGNEIEILREGPISRVDLLKII